jgi:hypothetical protein
MNSHIFEFLSPTCADVFARGRLAHALQLLGALVVRSAAHQQRAGHRAVLGALSVGRSGFEVWSVSVRGRVGLYGGRTSSAKMYLYFTLKLKLNTQ